MQMPPFMQRTKTVHKNLVKILDKVENVDPTNRLEPNLPA